MKPSKLILSLCAAVLTAACPSLAREIPAYLLQMGPSGKSHALVVDKKTQTLALYSSAAEGPQLVKEFRCTTGKNNNGPKSRKGDKKTPNGIYFFRGHLDDGQLPDKYGVMAFTMDYPNDYDELDNKTGSGIWLHAVDDDNRVNQSYDTEGCVVVTNEDIRELSHFIGLRDTPIIIDDSLMNLPPAEMERERKEMNALIDKWRVSWAGKDLDGYMDCYHERFHGKKGMNKKAWRDYKGRLNRQYKKIEVKVTDLRLWRYHDYTVASFIQSYKSSGFSASGFKLLYLMDSKEGWKIFSEKM
ncbi:L,D-transpeptidase [bacterium]|nr:L,D-transpeptidase [bacterium]